MPQVLSKIPLTSPIYTSCMDYVHPWTDSCLQATCGLYLYCMFDSLRVYGTVYLCTLLMKGRIPTKEDLKRTLYGILQSTAFLSFTGFGYSMFLCSLRKVLGHFNLLTVSAIPAFLSSVFAILIERPSRRTLLCLYVSNVATETLWNMAVARNMVRNVRFGDVTIFGASMALLLTYFKGGYYQSAREDSMFGVLRFVIGPYEEKDFTSRSSQSFYRQQVRNNPADGQRTSQSWRKAKGKNTIFYIVNEMLRIYKKIVYKVKCCDRHNSCPHPFSCLYYVLQGAGKMFSVGLGIQVTLKLVLNIRRIFNSPSSAIKHIFFKKHILDLATFLGAYSGIFRASMCILRRIFGKDTPSFALPAGLFAGLAFTRYPDSTVMLYVMWKAAQLTYNLGIQKGMLPNIPGFTEFLYCFSTAVLFHAAILEPTNLRPSYWKFLHANSGGRIACMSRNPLDSWGLNTSDSLKTVLQSTKTVPVVLF